MDDFPQWAMHLAAAEESLEHGRADVAHHLEAAVIAADSEAEAVAGVGPEAEVERQAIIGSCRHAVGRVFARIGETGRAETLLRDGLTALELALPPTHAVLSVALISLAGVYLYGDPSRSAEAEPLLRRALGILSATSGTKNVDAAAVMQHLAVAHRLGGRPREALPLLKRALEIYATREGETARAVGLIAHAIGKLNTELGDDAAALPHLERSVEVLLPQLPADRPPLSEIRADLSATYARLGRNDAAQAVLATSGGDKPVGGD